MMDKANSLDHILIRGPRGTGKSHFIKLFKDHPNGNSKIVQLNCAAITSNLVDSELYGYVKGAFTGAMRDTPGHIETAKTDGKVIVLEELNSLTPDSQAKLLVYLETFNFFPVGGRIEKKSKSRIIATMNDEEDTRIRKDLEDRFKIVVNVPPLHLRREDILYFIENYSPPLLLSPAELIALLNHNWPGNVRELQKTLFELECLGACEADTEVQYLPENLSDGKINIEEVYGQWMVSLLNILKYEMFLTEQEVLKINEIIFGGIITLDLHEMFIIFKNRGRGAIHVEKVNPGRSKEFLAIKTSKGNNVPIPVLFTFFKKIFGDEAIRSKRRMLSLEPFPLIDNPGIMFFNVNRHPTCDNRSPLKKRFFDACSDTYERKRQKANEQSFDTLSIEEVSQFLLIPNNFKQVLIECTRRQKQSYICGLWGFSTTTLNRLIDKINDNKMG